MAPIEVEAAPPVGDARPGMPARLRYSIAVGHLLEHLFRSSLPPVFLLLRPEFNLSYTQLGILGSALSFSAGLLQPLSGYLSDRLGFRVVWISGMTVLSVTMFLSGLAPAFAWLIAFQLLAGFGSSTFHPATYGMVARLSPRATMGKNLAFHTFSGFAGTSLSFAVIGPLSAVAGWRTSLWIISLVGIAYSFYIWRKVEVPDLGRKTITPVRPEGAGAARAEPDAAEPAAIKPTGEALNPGPDAVPVLQERPRPRVWLGIAVMTFMMFAVGMISQGVNSFLPTFLNDVYGTSVASSGLITSLLFWVGTFSVLLGGRLADRFPKVAVSSLSALTASVSLLILALANLPTAWLLLVVSLVGLGRFTGQPAELALVTRVFPGGTGRAFGIIYGAGYLGGAAGGLVGAVADWGGIRTAFALLAGLSLLRSMAIWLVKPLVTRAGPRGKS